LSGKNPEGENKCKIDSNSLFDETSKLPMQATQEASIMKIFTQLCSPSGDKEVLEASEKAKTEFEKILKEKTPANIKTKIQAFLDAIKKNDKNQFCTTEVDEAQLTKLEKALTAYSTYIENIAVTKSKAGTLGLHGILDSFKKLNNDLNQWLEVKKTNTANINTCCTDGKKAFCDRTATGIIKTLFNKDVPTAPADAQQAAKPAAEPAAK
jgi:hypothetical protein